MSSTSSPSPTAQSPSSDVKSSQNSLDSFGFVYETLPPSTLQNVLTSLEEYGVCVVSSLLSPSECSSVISSMHKWIEFYGILKDTPSTWQNITDHLGAKHGGLLQNFFVGQQQFCWDVRQNKKVIEVFQKIWGTEELYTSFDGANISPPMKIKENTRKMKGKHHTPKEGKEKKENFYGHLSGPLLWLHSDQSDEKKGLCGVQGIVTMGDVDDGDATLLVLKGSHHYHQEFFNTFRDKGAVSKDDWYKLKNEEIQWFVEEKKCPLVAVKAPEGSLILWDSRTIHQGLQSSPIRTHRDRWRYVVYVAMFPRENLRDDEVEKRKKFLVEGRTSNHWGLMGFPLTPRGNTMKPLEYKLPILNDIGRKLI